MGGPLLSRCHLPHLPAWVSWHSLLLCSANSPPFLLQMCLLSSCVCLGSSLVFGQASSSMDYSHHFLSLWSSMGQDMPCLAVDLLMPIALQTHPLLSVVSPSRCCSAHESELSRNSYTCTCSPALTALKLMALIPAPVFPTISTTSCNEQSNT